MSHQSDNLHKPCGQMKDQGLKTQKSHPPLMELILRLRQLIDDYSRQLKIRHLQEDLEQEKQWHSQDTREQEAILVQLLGEVANLLQAGATSSLELQLPRLPLDSRGGGGQQAQLPRKPDQLSHQLSDSKAAVVSCDLSNRGIDISASYKSSFKDFIAYQGDKYHEDKNTLGLINLGLSENKLCIDLLTERLSRSDMNYIDDDLLQYPDWSGHSFLREEVARFLTYYCKAPEQLDPENVVVLSGCCAIFSALTLVLCNPGDAFLIITPFYSGFTFASSLYVNVELIRVHLDSEITEADTQPFQLTVDKLEKALLEARLKGKKVKGLVLINPNNPLGDIYSRDSLMEYLEFAKRYNLHVIIDEIYMGTVFDESIPFHSVLSLESLPDPNRTHVIWGTSKEFGISGFRFGTLYTHNKEVVSAVGAFGFLHSISGITQHKLCRLLQDREWIDNVYLPTNRSRMQEAHRYITDRLKTLKIPFLNRGSGLYIWVNLKEYLDPCTFEEEQLLYHRFLDNKLLLAPGKAYMCKEPGWFRLTFTDKPLRLKVGLGQLPKAKTKSQNVSHQSDALHRPHPQVMKVIQRLQKIINEYILQLESRHQQEDLEQEEQQHSQNIRDQEAILVHLMCEVVNLLHSGASSSVELQLPRLSLDSRGGAGGGQQAQSSREPDQLSHQLSDSETAFISCYLSNRGIDVSALYQSNFQDFVAYQGDKYHEDRNTLGLINLGLSENKLCIDLLTERLSRSDMNYIDDDLLQYPDWRGHAFLREEVARFLTYYCKAPDLLDPENVVVLNSSLSVFLTLTMVLCDPGDAFLIPTPFSSGFTLTARLYSKVELIHVHLLRKITEADTQPFQLIVDKLEKALLEAKFKGKKVRGLVLFNPNNFMGDIDSLDSLKEYLEFAKRHNLHVIIDETSMLSEFHASIPFHSVLNMKSLPDPNRTHVIWGTSKSFGISGFRFGTLYTHNKEVVSAVGAFGFLHSISGITQHKLCRLLQDREWIDNMYLPTNRSRMQEAHRYITNKLKTLKVPFLSRGSGLYIWVNLKEYLDPCTFEEEQLLYRHFLDNKLLLAPGKAYMCKEPGWFRLTFTDKPLRLKVAIV
uniref:Aminotransferase class I/classII large domain-containing protein n=1 Tax=Myotis myotis TaxID=51298 RepID=A0A7J7VFM8_MYOMY|nr:hypothetical protein mMyoMyo1_000189 [Myotis myotis]